MKVPNPCLYQRLTLDRLIERRDTIIAKIKALKNQEETEVRIHPPIALQHTDEVLFVSAEGD